MRQIVFKLIAPGVPLYEVIAGTVLNGTFESVRDIPEWMCSAHIEDSDVEYSDLLGGQAYIRQEHFMSFVHTNIESFLDAAIYANFVVFTLKEDENEK